MTCPVIDDGFGSKAKLAIDCVSAIIVKLIIPLVNPFKVAIAVYWPGAKLETRNSPVGSDTTETTAAPV